MQIRPDPHGQRLEDPWILADCLEMEKHLGQLFGHAVMESATPELRAAFEAGQRDCLELADDIFRLMHQLGWYPLRPAPPEAVADLAATFQPVTTATAAVGPGPWARTGPAAQAVAHPTYASPPGGIRA